MTRKGLELAREMFARAIALDPAYTRAYAGLADCCCFLYQSSDANMDNVREALSASARAVDLDPQAAEAHASCGFSASVSKNYEHADKEFQIAIDLDSRLFEAHFFYARSCFERGQYAKAASLFEDACRADPDDYQAYNLRGLCFRALRETRLACEAFRCGVRAVERHLQLYPQDARVGHGSQCSLRY